MSTVNVGDIASLKITVIWSGYWNKHRCNSFNLYIW